MIDSFATFDPPRAVTRGKNLQGPKSTPAPDIHDDGHVTLASAQRTSVIHPVHRMSAVIIATSMPNQPEDSKALDLSKGGKEED